MSIDERAFNEVLEGTFSDPYDVTIKHHREFIKSYEAAKGMSPNPASTDAEKRDNEQPDDCRKAFENHAKYYGLSLTISPSIPDCYLMSETRRAWEAFQAAWKIRSPERESIYQPLAVAARTYFDRYMQDEAADIENCLCGEQQHTDALAVQEALIQVEQSRRG